MKKILLFVLCIVILLCVVSCGKDDVAEDLTWKIEDEVLIISGNGRMPDYVDENGEMTERPWEAEIKNFYFIEIESGITSVGAYAFKGCNKVVEVSLPDGLKSIGDYAFQRCLSLGEVILPDDVESIGNNAFQGCNSMYKVNIHKNIVTIGDYAFQRCLTLSEVKLSDGLESIGVGAFTDSYGQNTITFDGTKSRWEEIGGVEATDEKVTVKCSDGTFGE